MADHDLARQNDVDGLSFLALVEDDFLRKRTALVDQCRDDLQFARRQRRKERDIAQLGLQSGRRGWREKLQHGSHLLNDG